jgi:hypothetical protein
MAYVKNEGSNFKTMTTALKSIVSCDVLGLIERSHDSYFGHAFFKVC